VRAFGAFTLVGACREGWRDSRRDLDPLPHYGQIGPWTSSTLFPSSHSNTASVMSTSTSIPAQTSCAATKNWTARAVPGESMGGRISVPRAEPLDSDRRDTSTSTLVPMAIVGHVCGDMGVGPVLVDAHVDALHTQVSYGDRHEVRWHPLPNVGVRIGPVCDRSRWNTAVERPVSRKLPDAGPWEVGVLDRPSADRVLDHGECRPRRDDNLGQPIRVDVHDCWSTLHMAAEGIGSGDRRQLLSRMIDDVQYVVVADEDLMESVASEIGQSCSAHPRQGLPRGVEGLSRRLSPSTPIPRPHGPIHVVAVPPLL